MLFSPLIPDRDALFENIVLLLVYHAMCFPSSSFTMSLPPELPFRYPCNHHTIDCRDNFSVCQCRPSGSNRSQKATPPIPRHRLSWWPVPRDAVAPTAIPTWKLMSTGVRRRPTRSGELPPKAVVHRIKKINRIPIN